ncbi:MULTISPECIES: copper transporter [unclassified Schaalia]|uniref:copper transporter n=1 Tax=unclassified Schaalia TaxID=2691889 RepID=UPI001E3119D4|nr:MULTISPECIES: copper transporter [unclassified Schaalia]MCD4550356.1 copper transporter [Schaalia sp. lx-260]MCD4556923.1 copper transporter [Schaalia sp. lx-100]
MVNFRYHVVSLIAVFAALAIGVVLGAGPLQTRVASVASSRNDSAANSAETARLKTAAEAEAVGVKSIAAQILTGKLSDVAVVTVALPGASSDDVALVRTHLETAGAKIAGAVSLSDNWDADRMATYRQTLATPIQSHLTSSLGTNVTSDGVIGAAIVEVLTSSGAERDLVQEILTDANTPIMSIDQQLETPAQALLLIGPRSSGGTGSGEAQAAVSDRAVSAWVGIAQAVAKAPQSGVLLGDASSDSAMLAQVRTLGAGISTVDSVGTATAALSAVLALPQAKNESVAYGSALGAQQGMPKIS